MNKQFVLPERWAVLVTKENLLTVGRYYNRQGASVYTDTDKIGLYLVSHNLGNDASVMDESIYYGANFSATYLPAAFQEITFEQFENYVINALPEYWAVEVTKETKKAVGKWRTAGSIATGGYVLNKIDDPKNFSTTTAGKDTIGFWVSEIPKKYTLISKEQFLKYIENLNIVVEEEVFPEKWVVFNDGRYEDLINFFNIEGNGAYPPYVVDGEHYFHYPITEEGITTSSVAYAGYTKISIEQFRKHVLNHETMEKEIIGYKLVKNEYKSAALSISNTIANWENSLMSYDVSVKQTGYIDRLTKAGVLDLWFEPVYKPEKKKLEFEVGDWIIAVKDGANCSNHPEYNTKAWFATDMGAQRITRLEDFEDHTVAICHNGGVARIETLTNHFRKLTKEEILQYTTLPMINTYDGKDRGDYLEYGCAKLSVSWFKASSNRHIETMKLSSGVEINKEQMNQIRQYLQQRDGF